MSSIWAYLVIGWVAVALAAFVVLVILIVFDRRSARPHWDDW